MQKFGLVIFVEILSGVDSDHVSGPRWQCQLKVNIMANIKKVMLTKDAPLSAHRVDWTVSF